MIDLDALESLAAKATPRPWTYRVSGDAVYLDADRGGATRGIAASIHSELDETNYALIVAAVNALPELLALARLNAAKGSE